jgi:capsular polysaccharide biosynthesis protein
MGVTMELRDYARVIGRYLWIIIVLPVVVGLGSWILRTPPAPVYQASIRFTIGVNAPPASAVIGYDPVLTSYQASEYIRDDFVEIVASDSFTDDVNAQLARMGVTGITVRKGNISGTIEKQRRLMSLTVTWNQPDQAQKIAEAAVQNLAENNGKYFAQLGSSAAALTIVDRPVVGRVGTSLREQLDIPIRIALALLAGLALAFILDYLDTSVRDAREVQALGLQVIGEIPREQRFRK